MEPKEFSPLADLIDGLTDGFLSANMVEETSRSTTNIQDGPQPQATVASSGDKKSSEPVTTSSHGK